MAAASHRRRHERRIQLSPQQSADVRAAFELFLTRDDAIEANRINARELTCALQALGFEPRRGEVTELVTRHSSTGDGTIDVDTFERIITDKLNESEPVELLAHAFALFDEDGDGFITAADIERIAKDLGGDELEPSEISLMIAEAALADTERVSLDDFLRVMRRT